MNTDLTVVEPDPQRDHQIYQCLVSGIAPYDAAVHFGVPVEYVLPIRDELPEFMRQRSSPPALRKEIALARTDMAMRALMPAVEKGDHEAIDLMLKVQKREAAMTGLDAPIKSDGEIRIVIDAPWMNKNRLSYQREPEYLGLIADATDAAVIEPAVIETALPNRADEVTQARAEHEAAQIKAREKVKAGKARAAQAIDGAPVEPPQPQAWRPDDDSQPQQQQPKEGFSFKASDLLPAPDPRVNGNPSGPKATPKRAP